MTDKMTVKEAIDAMNNLANGGTRSGSIEVNCDTASDRDRLSNIARQLLKKGFVKKVVADKLGNDLRVVIEFR